MSTAYVTPQESEAAGCPPLDERERRSMATALDYGNATQGILGALSAKSPYDHPDRPAPAPVHREATPQGDRADMLRLAGLFGISALVQAIAFVAFAMIMQ